MQIFFSEYPADYSKYNFPYQVYGIRQKEDKNDDLYEMGMLPTRIDKDLFYLCRSLRISLEDFQFNSENRRVKRKAEYLKAELIELEKFDYDYEIGKMAKAFSKERFEGSALGVRSVKNLFTESAMTHVIQYTDSGKPVGYALCLLSEKGFHYSYPFYDLTYFEKNIGMGMILNAIEIALDLKKVSFYLGTCYTKKSLYKLQFNNMEYYTGFGWSSNIEQLKQMISKPMDDHLFKLIEDKSSFINYFKNGK